MRYERSRIKDTRIPTVVTVTSTDYEAPVVEEHGYIGRISEMSDVNNRNFKHASAAGYLVMGDCKMSRTEREYTAGHISGRNHTSGWAAEMEGDLMYIIAGAPPEEALTASILSESQLLVKAFAKINESPVLTGEILGTMNQNLALLTKPARAIGTTLSKLNSLTAFRRHLAKLRRGAYPMTVADVLSGNYLKYRYGIVPAILDIKSVVDKLIQVNQPIVGQRLVARVTSKAEIQKTAIWEPMSDKTSDAGTRLQKLRASNSAGVFYEINLMKTSDSWADHLGLGTRSAASTAWELLPWSYMYDWFSNVGEWLAAMNPNPAVIPLGWWTTKLEVTTISRSAFIKYFGSLPKTYWTGKIGEDREQTVFYRRTCNQPLSSTPEFLGKYKLGTLHQLDAASLAIQRIVGSLREHRRW